MLYKHLSGLKLQVIIEHSPHLDTSRHVHGHQKGELLRDTLGQDADPLLILLLEDPDDPLEEQTAVTALVSNQFHVNLKSLLVAFVCL